MGEAGITGTPGIAIIDPVGQKAGLDDYDTQLARALRTRSCFIRVYSNFSNHESASEIVNHFTFSFRKNIFRAAALTAEFVSALRKAKKLKIGIVVLHLFHFSLTDLMFIRLARYFGFRVCLIVHDVENILDSSSGRYLLSCFRLAASVIVHNKFSLEEMAARTGNEPHGKIQVIPHGMFRVRREAERPLQAYEYFNLDISKRYLLFFGMLKRAKSLEVLLEALAKLPEDIHLIVAGRPRDMDYSYYSRLILKLGISGRVHSIIRYVTNEERHFLFTIPEAVVLPYRRIYQSGVLLLAMSYGLPVIASDLPANREVINNRNGTLFITGDSSDLADKIHLLLEDEARMKSISDSARDYVLQYHNWERIGDQFMQVFETMQ